MGNKIKNKTGEWVGESAPRNARLCLCHLKAWKLNPHANMLNGNKGNHHQQKKTFHNTESVLGNASKRCLDLCFHGQNFTFWHLN